MSRYDAEGLEAGSWGEFFVSLEHMTTRMQSSKFTVHDVASAQMMQLEQSAVDNYNAALARLAVHTNLIGMSHDLTAESLGLGYVDNRSVATVDQITAGGVDDLYISPDGYSALAAKVFGNFSSTLHSQGINPISTYGDISWLPPDVSGSFEGSGMASGDAGGFSLIEDDGTWIGVRRGTNGTSQGLYYFYMGSAEDKADAVGPVRMNLRYSPANRPSGFECLDTISSDVTCMVGTGYGHATYNGFVSITNGTMDVSKHYVGYFNVNTAFGGALSPFASACVAGNYVYLFLPFYSMASTAVGESLEPYDFKVFRCTTASIVAGGAVTWEAVTTWNCTGLWGVIGSVPNIRLSKAMVSKSAANQPFVLHEGRNWVATLNPVWSGRRSMCCVNPTNTNQIRLNIHHTLWSQIASGTSLMPNLGFSVLIDVSAKTAKVEDGASYVRHVSPDQNTLTLNSPIIMSAVQITGYNYSGNYWPNSLVTARGYVLSRGSGNQPDESNRFTRAQISNFVSRYDALRIRNRVMRPIMQTTDPLVTGSAFTNGSMNPRLLAGGWLMFNGSTYQGSDQFTYGRAKRLQFVGNPTYGYKTMNSGTVNGWAPNGTRSEFGTITFNQGVFISRTGTDGTIATDASVATSNAAATTAGTAISNALAITGTFNYTKTEGNNLALSAARTLLGKTTITSYNWVIYFPQDTNLPVLMVMSATALRDDTIGCDGVFAILELNYTGARSGTVSGYTTKRIINSVKAEKVPGDTYIQYETMGGLQSYKCADGSYIMSVGCPAVIRTYGGQTGRIWYVGVKAGAKTVDDATIRGDWHGYYPTSANPSGFVHPTYGLGVMNYQLNQANFNAVLAINFVGTTYADFTSWGVKQTLIVGAQEVEQGWLLYFTSSAPVFLAGREYTLPPTNVDLRNVDSSPGNKTFYVYVRLTTTGIEYYLTTQQLGPTMTMMYIGIVTTGTSGIASIAIAKRIRVDTFELSAPHIGSGIPISTGVPSGSGNFAWFPSEFTKMLFQQYDVNGVQRASTNDFDIGWVDIALGNSAAISNATIDLVASENTSNNQGQRFTYSGSQNGTYTTNLRLTGVNIPVNGAVRVYVRVADTHDRSLRVNANFTVTLTYGNNRMVRTAETFGYQLKPINNPDVSFGYYDANGNGQNATNNYEIGSLDLIYNPGFTMNNVNVQINDTDGSDRLLYSLNPGGPFSTTLNFTEGTMNNGDRRRIYVQCVDNNTITGRVSATMSVVTSYSNGQVRSAGSGAYGHSLRLVQGQTQLFTGSLRTDDSGYVDINLRTGAVTYAINNDRRGNSSVVTCYNGEQWDPALRLTGFEDYNNYVTATRVFSGAARALQNGDSAAIALTYATGRGSINITRQPSAANDWTARVFCRDPQDGSGTYTFTIVSFINT